MLCCATLSAVHFFSLRQLLQVAGAVAASLQANALAPMLLPC